MARVPLESSWSSAGGHVLLGSVCCALLASAPATSSAQPAPTEAIRIRFNAHAGCPTEQKFTQEVQARTARARIAVEGESARVFDVAVASAGAASQGKLSIIEPGGATSVREVSGRVCAEVVSALALIAALAIDPKASTAPEPVLQPRPPQPLPPEPTPVLPPGEPFALPSAAPRGQTLVARRERSEIWPPLAAPLPAWVPRDAVLPPKYRLGAGGGLVSMGTLAPSMTTGGTLFVELALSDDQSILSPSFRLSLAYAESSTATTDVGDASFAWIGGRLDACPFRFGEADLDARACGTLDAGVLEGTGLETGVSQSRPWVAPGLLGRVGWMVVRPFWIEAQGGLNLPLVRDTFKFDNPKPEGGTTVHEPSAVGGLVGVGVGVRF